jgi:hypothetical protein
MKTRALSEFESLLEREHQALSTRDIDALEALADARQSSVIRMLKLEDERRSLCSMLGYDTDLSGLARLIAWCDPRARCRSRTKNVDSVRRKLPRPERPQRPAGRRTDQARRGAPRRHHRRGLRAARLRPRRAGAYTPRAGQVLSGRSLIPVSLLAPTEPAL